MDRYSSFEELARVEQDGVDYRRVIKMRSSGLIILAPHGGGIEPGTSEIAAALAGEDHSLYLFEGLKPVDSFSLHLSSVNFDEPECLKMVHLARAALAVHGCEDPHPLAYVGGRNTRWIDHLLKALAAGGFPAVLDRTNHSGRQPANICNRCLTGEGVQLELSAGLRRQFFAGLSRSGRRVTRPRFHDFIQVTRGALESLLSQQVW
jgi:phage replication-related protein YjqB (UPF0714/DUF867 family)